MIITRLKTRLVLWAVVISLVMALTFMLAVSWVISQQYLKNAQVELSNAVRIINDNLNERKATQLQAARQLAGQKLLGSTLWYLTHYLDENVNPELLFVTYQQLVKDTYKTARATNLSRIALYNDNGQLITFASLQDTHNQAGYVERRPLPVFQVATLNAGDELNRNNLRTVHALGNLEMMFPGKLPQQEDIHYRMVDGLLSIESFVPVMGEVFNAGKLQTRQLGLLVMVQPLDQKFVEQLGRLTGSKINIFNQQGQLAGALPGYLSLDQRGMQVLGEGEYTFNEIKVDTQHYYQNFLPLYNGTHRVASIAALSSAEVVRENTAEMIEILAGIAFFTLLIILPFGWYLAASISRPVTVLSSIFRRVAAGEGVAGTTLSELDPKRRDELGDLTRSFIAMDEAVKQKIRQIEEINATLEEKIELRTRELKLANIELTRLARYDVLTGLPNRQLLSDRLNQALVLAHRDMKRSGLMFIDLDEFKPINDQYGHAVGDQVLLEVARRIQGCIRESDTVSRIGGDEFIVLLPVIETAQDATEVAEKIRVELNQPFKLNGNCMSVSSSIGISVYPDHGGDEATLVKNADTAMYAAKNAGRNNVKLFLPDSEPV